MQGIDEVKITSAPSEPMDKDDTFQLTVEGMSSSNVTWTSSDTDVVTVSPDGKVTAVGPGIAEITAEYDGKVSEPVEITVSGIAVGPAFGTSLSSGTTDKTITLKAYGNADLSDLDTTPTIEPSGAVTLTQSTGSDGAIIYTVSAVTATSGDVTISFGGDTEPITFTIVPDELKVSIDGEEVVTGIKGGDKAEIDLSDKLADGEEIATIKDSEGNVLYDVNNPESTDKDVVYDPEDKTLTVNVDDANSGNIDIVAEKVKVLLYDALLSVNGKTYTKPTLNNTTLVGKYATPSEAAAAIPAMTFKKGAYVKLLTDFTEDSFSPAVNGNITLDMSGHYLSKGSTVNPPNKCTYNRIIHTSISSGSVMNIIDGTLKDNILNAGSDALGAAIYASGTESASTSEWYDGNREKWGTLNLFNVTLSDNYADCGGAICLQGAVEFNAYNSSFIGNKSQETKDNLANERGSGAAIYVWSANAKGEVVNLYDCTFTENKGDGIISVGDQTDGVIFNIFSGEFTGNTLTGSSPFLSGYSFNVFGGNLNGLTLNLYSGYDDAGIAGGIIGTLDIASTADAFLQGGSVDTVNAENDNVVLASAKLNSEAKVEYVSYGDNYININSPFKITADSIHYSYETGYSSMTGDEYNGSEFNPEITEFGIFLPAGEADSINAITVHCAGGTTVELTRDTTVTDTIAFVE